jgi:hypothetical protein
LGVHKVNEYKQFDDYSILYVKYKSEIKEIIIDNEDLNRVINYKYSWHVNWSHRTQSFYAMATKYLGKIPDRPMYETVYLHRFIMEVDNSIDVDHFNHNTLDNRKNNLIIKDRSNNLMNRRGINKNNTSGERNVSWNSKLNKWLVQLQINGKNTCLGKFEYDDFDSAVELAKKLRKEIYNVNQ